MARYALDHQVRCATAVVKKRSGSHQDMVREYRLMPQGLALGEPLQSFQGAPRGSQTLLGQNAALLEKPSQ